MFDRIPKRSGIPAAALAGGVLFACIPLTPAMGLIGVPEVPQDTAQAGVVVAEPAPDYLSPVIEMSAAEQQRQILAEQAAKQRALELKAAEQQASLLTSGDSNTGGTTAFSTNGTPVTTGGPIPTTDVTGKTREIQGYIRKYFPSDQLGNAMAVSACESGHSDAKGAVNSDGTIDWGVFQLNDGGTLQAALDSIGVSYSSTAEARQLALKTEINVKAAAQIYAGRGWAPWVCAYKIGVVGGLYSNTPGPMDGKFDQWGKPTVDVPVIPVDPGANNDPAPPAPDPDPKPTKDPKPKPATSPSPQPKPSKSPTPQPTEPGVATPAAPAAPPQSQAPTTDPSVPPAGGSSSALTN